MHWMHFTRCECMVCFAWARARRRNLWAGILQMDPRTSTLAYMTQYARTIFADLPCNISLTHFVYFCYAARVEMRLNFTDAKKPSTSPLNAVSVAQKFASVNMWIVHSWLAQIDFTKYMKSCRRAPVLLVVRCFIAMHKLHISYAIIHVV